MLSALRHKHARPDLGWLPQRLDDWGTGAHVQVLMRIARSRGLGGLASALAQVAALDPSAPSWEFLQVTVNTLS